MASKREQFEQLIKKARTDFRLFCQIVGKITPGEHQKEWFRICQEIADNPFGNQGYVIIAPPGSGKSQVIGVLFPAFMIGKYPNEHFGLISYADKPAKDRAMAVRNIIEKSTEYHRIFPNVVPDRTQWGTYAFRVKRSRIADFHPTLRAGGATSSIVSYRLSGVIIDDPHDPKNTTTAEIKEKVYRNWEQAIKTRLLDGAFKLCITTRWADDDFAGTLLKKEKESWKSTLIQAFTSTGRSYWPDKYSVEKLESIRRESPELFSIQYMGDTTKGEAGIFQKLHTYSGEITRETINMRISTGIIDPFNQTKKFKHPEHGELDLLVGTGIDTALKDRQKNDFSVIYTGGIDQYGRIWLLDRRKGRWMLPELTDNIEEVYKEFQPYTFWIEDAASGTPAVQTLKAKLPYMPLTLQTPTIGGKRNRALAIAGYINNGEVLFPADSEWFEDANYFITRFGSAAYDDDVDALFMLLSNILVTIHPSKYSEDGRLKANITMR